MSDLVLPERALTLWQPWAWLVANGHKNIENRPKGFSHKSFRGEFWIHAGAGPYGEKAWQVEQAARQLARDILGHDPIPSELTFGAIIGRAKIVGILPPREPTIECSGPPTPWHFTEQFGFVVTDAVALKNPVASRGWQGFWRVEPALLEQLREAA